LHHAVRNSALQAIEYLLDHGGDPTRLNRQQEAPIHLAVIHNQVEALKVSPNWTLLSSILPSSIRLQLLIRKCPDQVNLSGDRYKTPLHYAALTDNLEAAQVLVSENFYHYTHVQKRTIRIVDDL
jgi:ankyrin repeat protein